MSMITWRCSAQRDVDQSITRIGSIANLIDLAFEGTIFIRIYESQIKCKSCFFTSELTGQASHWMIFGFFPPDLVKYSHLEAREALGRRLVRL